MSDGDRFCEVAGRFSPWICFGVVLLIALAFTDIAVRHMLAGYIFFEGVRP